jgi:hypothetical protein
MSTSASDPLVARLRQIKWLRSFIEYARYELQPGEPKIGDQFPRQCEADKALKIVDALLASLPPSEDAQGWRPIETAPQNAGGVLLGWPGSLVVSGHRYGRHEAWVTAHGEYFGSAAPTHWQPLPAPPVATTDRSA